MSLIQLQPLPPAGSRIVDAQGNMDPVFRLALQSILDQIVEAVNGVIAAQEAAAAAQTAAAAAQTAADNAQDAADAAQAAVDGLNIPPSGARTVTTDDTFSPGESLLLADATAGPIVIALPLATSMTSYPGVALVVRKVDASANAVSIIPDGSDFLNGGTSPISVTTQGAALGANSDGVANWYA